MTIPLSFRRIAIVGLLCLLSRFASLAHAQSNVDSSSYANNANYERITAYLRGVYGPRGYFNLVVGLYTCPLAGLYGAQFNIKPGLMVLDIAPGYPRVTIEEMHHIEKISGYSPGRVEIEEIQPADFAEAGPGWRKIQPPQSKNRFIRWFKQNFVNHHH